MFGALIGGGLKLLGGGTAKKIISGAVNLGKKIVKKGTAAAKNPTVRAATKTAAGAVVAGAGWEAGSRVATGGYAGGDPGGTSIVPYNGGGGGGAGMDGGGFGFPVPLIVEPEYREAARAPRGYVIVTDPQTGAPIAMLKAVAYALGLRKRSRRGGGISASDIRRAKKVQRVIAKLTVGRQPKFKLKRKGR